MLRTLALVSLTLTSVLYGDSAISIGHFSETGELLSFLGSGNVE